MDKASDIKAMTPNAHYTSSTLIAEIARLRESHKDLLHWLQLTHGNCGHRSCGPCAAIERAKDL